MRLKPKQPDTPEYTFMVGQLVGAAKMAVAAMEKVPEMEQFAKRLHAVSDWFVEETKNG